jgi:hypothetical protein
MIKSYLLSSHGKQVYEKLVWALNRPQYKNAGREMIVHVKSEDFDALKEGIDKDFKAMYQDKNEIPFMNHILKRAGS